MRDETHLPDPAIYDHDLAVSVAGGNPGIAAELLSLLLRELPLQRDALHEAFARDDLDQLRKISHKLHGSASYCGTRALKAAASELETVLPEGAPDRIEGTYRRVLEEIERVLQVLETQGPGGRWT